MPREKLQALLSQYLSYEPTPSQSRVIHSLSHFLTDPEPSSLFILRGFAGTGKTTMVSALVQTLDAYNIRTVLLAPTGRAAKVLAGYTGRRAHTIHKTIYLQRTLKDGRIILVPAPNKARRTLFIVDEASMIQDQQGTDNGVFPGRDVLEDLFHHVYGGQQCRLMFIGDTAQLPPVGMTLSPALDSRNLKARFHVHVYEEEMTDVVRQEQDSGILSNATRLREMLGREEITYPLLKLDGQLDVQKLSGYELQETLGGYYRNTDETVVITRSNKRANLFNEQIRTRILGREEALSTGDLLMVVKNNYFWLEEQSQAGFLANGDIIEILHISGFQSRHGLHFADISCSLIDYPDQAPFEVKILLDTLRSEGPSLSNAQQQALFQSVYDENLAAGSRRTVLEKVRQDVYYQALQVKFAYALTCHKTQGGQWPVVFIDQGYITRDQVNIEYLRWLYTAITRGSRKVFLIGFAEELAG